MASELGVQTIQHTNGTDAMTIDSSGVVNFNNTPTGVGFIFPASQTLNGQSSRTFTGIPSGVNIIKFGIWRSSGTAVGAPKIQIGDMGALKPLVIKVLMFLLVQAGLLFMVACQLILGVRHHGHLLVIY